MVKTTNGGILIMRQSGPNEDTGAMRAVQLARKFGAPACAPLCFFVRPWRTFGAIIAAMCIPIWSMAQSNTNVGVYSGVGTNSLCGIGALQERRANVHDLIDSTVASDLLATNVVVRRALLDAKGAQDLGELGPQDTEVICSLLGKLDGFQPTPNASEAMRYPRFMIVTVPGYMDAPSSFKRKVYVNAYLVHVPTRGWFFLETRRAVEPVQ